jgi:single-stranded-DNA-specific exonuclease
LALRFSQTPWYKQEVCLLNLRPVNDAFVIEAVKTVNLMEKERLTETIVPGLIKLQQTKLLPFLAGQLIYTWDAPLQKKQLEAVFGKAYEFQLIDLREEAAKLFPSVARMSLLKIKESSRIARYCDEPQGEIDGFFNFFVTYAEKSNAVAAPAVKEREIFDLELVALAAVADIMPLVDENRLFIRSALAAMNSGTLRPGLAELFARIGIGASKLAGLDLAWKVTPVLNAPGRFGKPELVAALLFSEEPLERDSLAREILELNEKRKTLEASALPVAEELARKGLDDYSGRLALAIDERLDRGVTGLLANSLLRTFGVTAVVAAFVGDRAVGSVRTGGNVDAHALLTRFRDQIGRAHV